MIVPPTARKPWAVLAYTVADDRGGGSPLDRAAQRELKQICDAADFRRVSVAAQVDFRRPRGVFRGSITERPPEVLRFADVRAESHPLWQKILGSVDESRSDLRVQAESRDRLREFLESRGVETKIHYPIPIHLQKAAEGLGYKRGAFPVCEAQSERIVSLPVHEYLTEAEQQYVVDRIREFYRP